MSVNPSVRRIRVPIPLNGSAAQNFNDSFIRNTIDKLKNITVFKPGRVLGACWTDDKVGTGKAVTMCGNCVHKYHAWWRKFHYRGDWGWSYTADCDGCGERNIRATLFMPEHEFYNSLGKNHGREPEIRR